MSDLVVLGTDTAAGKTTFSLLWMTAFRDHFAYWKPVETGDSDSDLVRRLVPDAVVLPCDARFPEAVAPPLAAKRAGQSIPRAEKLVHHRPGSDRTVLVESFGSPLSPLTESELQIEFVRRLGAPAILVTPSAVGAVGRTLSTLHVLRSEGVDIRSVVLVGPADEYAIEEIKKHGRIAAFGLDPPASWDTAGLVEAASRQRVVLEELRGLVSPDQEHFRPRADDLIARDRRTVWHPYTSQRDPDPPLPVVAARDEFLTHADGRLLIDGISSWWTILHGHRHPRLMRGLREASERIDHVVFAGATHEYAVEVAEGLLKTAPWPNGRVFFSDNGSTAVEVALKMAYQYWCHRGESQRTLFVGFEGGYHGDTFGAMSVGRDPVFFGRFEPLLFRAERVPVLPELLDVFLSKWHHHVAAVIIEPLIQAAGGMRFHSPHVLRDLYAVARRHHVLFIADEVMTAFRTGAFWAHTAAGIAPDFICAAKTLAGGVLPLAATLVAPEVVAAFDTDDRAQTFFHGHSFTGHPLACAVAAENLRVLADGAWREQAKRIRNRWGSAKFDLGELPGVRNARACGTVLALDVGSGGYLADVGRRMRAACLDHGVLLRPLGNVLYALPPLRTSDASLDRIVTAMRAAILAAKG
ncbi:MAG: adenosylmethionine--8-amino-7-oxononanoate transaminase [Zavarzinella sp.]|nr:adenosylmethionine--8-amino-7-oxononanoate transaminase [Zavarzinella sp.]